MAVLGSNGPVKRVAVLGLGKQEESALTPAAFEALGVEVPYMFRFFGLYTETCM